MRLSSVVASILLGPAFVLAQHTSTNTSSTSTSSPSTHSSPSPPSISSPSSTSSTQPSSAASSISTSPSMSSTSTNSAGVHHSTEPSSSHSNTETHGSSANSVVDHTASHVDSTRSVNDHMAHKAPDVAETPDAPPASKRSAHRVDVEPMIEAKTPKHDAKQKDKEIMVSPEAETKARLGNDVTADGNQRHPKGCAKEPCPAPSPTPVANKSCKGEYCEHPACPTGSAPDKAGVCRAYTPPAACPPGYVQRSGGCAMASQETSIPVECGSFQGRASILALQLRNLQSDIRRACSQDPSGDECIRLKQSQSMLLLEYQGLLSEAPNECHSLMPSYASLM
jgi:hypothetical protein